MARTSRFVLDLMMTFGTNVISFVVGIASGIIVARSLGPEGKGIYALIAAFPGLVLSFIHLGVAQSVIYHVRKERAQIEKQRFNALLIAFIVSSLSVIALVLSKDYFFSSFLKDVPPKYFPIILFLVPVGVIEAYSASFLMAEEKFKIFNGIRLMIKIFSFAGIIVVLLVYDFGLNGLVWLYLVGCVAGAILSLFFSYWRKPISLRVDYGLLRRNISFGFKSYIQSLTGFLHYQIDIFMIATFLSATEVGYYSVAVGLASLIFFIPESIGLVLYPRLAGSDDKEADEFTNRVCRNTLFVTAVPAVGILLLGKAAIWILYGADFLPACDALYLLIPGIMVMCLYKIIGRNFTSRNKQGITITASLVGLVINVGMNAYLIPRLGIAGAALATTVSYSTTGIILLFMFVREAGCRIRDILLLNQSDIAAWFNLLWGRRIQIQKET